MEPMDTSSVSSKVLKFSSSLFDLIKHIFASVRSRQNLIKVKI